MSLNTTIRNALPVSLLFGEIRHDFLAAVGWKSPNSSISSTSSSLSLDETPSFSTLPTKSVKAPSPKPTNGITQMHFHTISNHQSINKSNQFQKRENEVNSNSKKSPMLRRMKLALAEAEMKNHMDSFQSTNQNDSSGIQVTKPIYQNSIKESSTTGSNSNITNNNLPNQNSWQNSTRKGTVKADEDFEFQGFPKPPPQFFPPPTPITTQTVQNSLNRPSGSLESPPKQAQSEFQDYPSVEIKRIPLIFKGMFQFDQRNSPITHLLINFLAPSPKSPDYKNEKTSVLDELKQKQESGTGTGTGNGPIYKKNRSPMLRRMKLALAHIENESDL